MLSPKIATKEITPSPAELRALCRLAWNNWADNEHSRRQIVEQEARDPISAAAWDRVVNALNAANRGDGNERD